MPTRRTELEESLITKELIEGRIKNFWGYGNLRSGTWFVGMEEGFHGDDTDLERRFNLTWNKTVIDLKYDMTSVKDHAKWFSDDAPIQRTWGKLIMILLVLGAEEPVDREKVREYQRKRLGRSDSDHCLLEFMPLPCRSTKEKNWIYGRYGIDYLSIRETYLEHVSPKRIVSLRKLIEEHGPERVIFYSKGYLDKWREIAGNEFRGPGKMLHNHAGKTDYFVIPHPAAHGMTNQDWLDIANYIKNSSMPVRKEAM